MRNRLLLNRNYTIPPGYYSQYGQDIFLTQELFPGKTCGFFVDIGAYDGVTLSNTYYLEKHLGWRGICFEPNPTPFAKLVKNRGAKCFNGAVSGAKGKSTLLKVTGYSEMLSGLIDAYDPRHSTRINNELSLFGGSTQRIEVTCYDLNEVLSDQGVRHVDYLTVDTEGSELEIIKSIDFNRFDIQSISVENNYESNQFEKYLRTKGFKLVAVVGIDEFYAKNTKSVADHQY